MPSYYDGKEFYNIKYATDIVLENSFKGILFPDETTLNRIIYSSNGYAFRKRATNKDSTLDATNLDLPFLNYKLKDFDTTQSDHPTWWNNRAYTDGIYIPELEKKIKFEPVKLAYEATFWCHKDDEMMYAMNQLRWRSDNQTLLTTPMTIDLITHNFPTHVFYTGLSIDPTYTEQDWLDRNKIHSIALDFEIKTWNILVNAGSDTTWRIADTLIFNFVVKHGAENTITYEEALEFVINHLTEEVEIP